MHRRGSTVFEAPATSCTKGDFYHDLESIAKFLDDVVTQSLGRIERDYEVMRQTMNQEVTLAANGS